MTSATPTERKAQGQTEQGSHPEGGLPFLRWEVVFYGLLIAVALSMRLWNLGARAFGYDESLHAYYSFRLAEGFEYQHSPLTHGPFQFHAMAALYFLLGDSDSVSRLLHALFGAALVSLPIFLRERLGRAGALTTAVLLAFSPMMLFYSRYARNDILMSVWTLGLVVLLWRYLDEGKPKYLIMSAVVLALAFATKETTFIVIAILGSYLLIVAAVDWIPWLLRAEDANSICGGGRRLSLYSGRGLRLRTGSNANAAIAVLPSWRLPRTPGYADRASCSVRREFLPEPAGGRGDCPGQLGPSGGRAFRRHAVHTARP